MNNKTRSINDNFGQLYEKHHEKILNSMTAMVRDRDQAEEVTAAASTKGYQHFDGFRGDASFSTWVHAIAFNAVISSHRLTTAPKNPATIGGTCRSEQRDRPPRPV